MFSDILLTVDYDRTLTAQDSTIPERNLEAIRWFIENGGAFTVNTGRSMPMIQPFKDKVPVNAPLLMYNGAVAYDVKKDELVFAHEIQLDMWKTVEELIALFPDLVVEVQALDKHYNFIPNPAWDAFSANNCAYATAQWGQDLGPFLKFSLYGEIRDITVDHLFHGSEEEIRRMDEAQALIAQRFGHVVVPFRAGPRIIDVHTKGVSKARAARELQQQLGRTVLVCVGDGENDVPMLREADFAYSPADGSAADRFENVCNCAEGAVADVIYRKIPELLK
jgi:HAD superfamily hydrolase (TIGR01484 family)